MTDALMIFRIHFEWPNGYEDSFIISGHSIEEIRDKAARELEQRRGTNPWSEQISHD